MVMQQYRGPTQRSVVNRAPTSSSLADVLNVILDKGIVIDAWARISVVGIEILTIEARVVIASVETYLRYAEAIGTTSLAAAPPEARGINTQQQDGRSSQNTNHRNQVTPDDVEAYLADHPEGVRMGDLQAYFDAPRSEISDALNQLVDEHRARLDEERRLYLPTGQGQNQSLPAGQGQNQGQNQGQG
jgi:gas vesicle structural protein